MGGVHGGAITLMVLMIVVVAVGRCSGVDLMAVLGLHTCT